MYNFFSEQAEKSVNYKTTPVTFYVIVKKLINILVRIK